MNYTTTLLDAFKKMRKIESDYGAAKALGLSQPAISNYRSGKSHADDRIAILLADELGLDRLQTIARINADRAKKPEDRAFWKRIAAAAAALCLAVYTAISPTVASAQDAAITATDYALCSVRRFMARFLRVVRSLWSNGIRHAAASLR